MAEHRTLDPVHAGHVVQKQSPHVRRICDHVLDDEIAREAGGVHGGGADAGLDVVPGAIDRQRPRLVGKAHRKDAATGRLYLRMRLQLDEHARARDQARHVAGVRAHVEIDVRRKAAVFALEADLAPRKGAVHPHHDEPHALADGMPGGAVMGVDIHVARRAALDARGIAQAREDLPPQGRGQARFRLQEHAQIGAGMFVQVLADPRPVADDLYAHLLQLAGRADAVLQQEGRGMDRPHAHDGVARVKGQAFVAPARLHAGDAQALENQLLHMGVADDG